jgi:hypothetical protein
MSKETKEQPIIDDKDLAKQVVNQSYDLAITHAIETIKDHIPDKTIASGLCINAIEYELNLIIDKLEKLKG